MPDDPIVSSVPPASGPESDPSALIAWLRANLDAALRDRDLALQEASQLRAQADAAASAAQGWQGSANTFAWMLDQVRRQGWTALPPADGSAVMSETARARVQALTALQGAG